MRHILLHHILVTKQGEIWSRVYSNILKGMEDHREELCVILAGYTNEMERMLNVNPGFESRIQFVINFPDYTAEELYMIFKGLCKKEEYKIAPNIKNYLVKYFEVAKKCINFSNARFVRSLFEKIKIEQANRVINEEENKNLIKLEDVLKAISNIKIKKDKVKQKIGFKKIINKNIIFRDIPKIMKQMKGKSEQWKIE